MNGKSEMAEWAKLVNDYFGAGLDEASAKRWGREIRSDCPNASPQDVIDAIRKHKTDNFQYKKVNVGDIIRWVRAVAPSSSKDIHSCRLCNRGLILAAPDLPIDGFSLIEYSLSYQMTVACLCSAGRYQYDIMKIDPNNDAYNQERNRAMIQRKEYLRLIERDYADIGSRSLVEMLTDSVQNVSEAIA